jgi:hypothetical protein
MKAMKAMKNRIMSLFLATVMLLGVVAAPNGGAWLLASASESDFAFEVNEDGESVTITGYSGTETELTIPDTLGGLPATAIGDAPSSIRGPFRNLTSVVLPETLEYIGDWAFRGARLPEVNLPESLIHIGEEAFATTQAVTVTIPRNVEFIGLRAFVASGNAIHYYRREDKTKTTKRNRQQE